VEVTDGIDLELLTSRARRIKVWQPADPVTLEAAMEGGTSELRDGGLECIEAVVEREQGMLAEGYGNGLLLAGECGGNPLLRPHGSIFHKGALPPFLDRLGVDPVTLRELQEALLTMLDRPTHRRRRAGAVV